MAADDAAPIVFALSCLTAILVPWTLLKLRRLARKSVAEADAWLALGFAPTSAVVAKARTSAPKTPWLSNILWVAAVACEVALLQNLPANESGPFDPYEVLGLERAASLAEIKSAYRGLALELHPDKNPSAEAAAQFLLVTKAHRVLTDATARDNYEKYGTPDGYQGFTGGVALPLVAENGALLLLGVVVGLPLLLWARYLRPARRRRDLEASAREAYVRAALGVPAPAPVSISRRSAPRADAVSGAALERLAAAVLDAHHAANPSAVPHLRALRAVLHPTATENSDGAPFAPPAASLLLEAHLRRAAVAPLLQPELAAVLASLSTVLDGFLAGATLLCSRGGLPVAGGVRPVIALAARCTQALSLRDHELLQVPGFDAKAAAAAAPPRDDSEWLDGVVPASGGGGKAKKKGKGGAASKKGGDGELTTAEVKAVKAGGAAAADDAPPAAAAAGGAASVSVFAALGDRERAALLARAGVEGAAASEAVAFCGAWPRPELKARAYVDDDDPEENDGSEGSVRAGDVLTIELKLRLRHREDDARSPPPTAHAPHHPAPKPEAWVLVVCAAGGGGLVGFHPVPPAAAAKGAWDCTMQLPASAAGVISLECHALCASYVGADAVVPLKVKVEEGSESDDDDDDDDDDDEAPELETDDDSE